jgi:hypothetical protein
MAIEEYKVCQVCHQAKPDVRERACGYSADINGTEVMEVICDSCEQEHLNDI